MVLVSGVEMKNTSGKVYGTGGNDKLSTAEPGVDIILGQRGDDVLDLSVSGGGAYGGMGDDTLIGGGPGVRQAHMYGGPGNDTIFLNTSKAAAPYGDHAWGGEGSDAFHFTTSPGETTRITGRLDDFDHSRDSLWLNGTKIDLYNLPHNVRIVQEYGQPWILIDNRILYGLEGARQFAGAIDADYDGDGESIEFGNGETEETHFIDWPKAWAKGVPESADLPWHDLNTFFPRDEYVGDVKEWELLPPAYTGGPDIITGTQGNDRLLGMDGADTIYGMGGNDLMHGGEYDDLMYGGDGHDSISGGLDNDKIWGGAGNDIIYGGSGQDTLYGGAGNDFISGNNGLDVIYGGQGHDTLMGGWSDDTIYGDAGNDLIYATFPDAQLAANFSLKAEMYGGSGNDTLHGLTTGSSTISGGEGEDTIVLEGYASAQILDFIPGVDYLDLNGLSPGAEKLNQSLIERIRPDGGTDMTLTLSGAASIVFQGLSELDRAALLASMGQEQPINPPAPPSTGGGGEEPGDGDDDDTEDEEGDSGGGGCFVATACFGSMTHPDVAWLRQFRNKILRQSAPGRAFIAFYHRYGPYAARAVRYDGPSGAILRRLLGAIVARGRAKWPEV